MIEDVLGWLVVLVGSIVIKFTTLNIIDPILSIVVALFILINALKNLSTISNIFLIKTPKNIDVDELIEHVKHIDGVIDVHHVHIWTLDGETNCATLHIVVKDYNSNIKNNVKDELVEHGISHVTIEMETDLENCNEKNCEIKKHECHCHHHHHH